MRLSFSEQLRRSRALASASALLIACGIALSGNAAFARVDPGIAGVSATLSEDARVTVTGGGTVLARPASPTTIASFGVTARRPAGFVSGGAAEGRINYDRHDKTGDRHVNVPVGYMLATAPVDRARGDALLLGDCASATCPSGISFVTVYVKDVADTGAGPDMFAIYFCSGQFQPPSEFVPGGSIAGCDGPEGDLLRSGNVTVREDH